MGRRSRNPYKGADRFTQKAKAEGYAARSVYKLTEIQKRFRVFRPGQRVVDLGCFPGSWSRYAAQQVGRRGRVVGVDLVPPSDPVGPIFEGSILELEPELLRQAAGGAIDVVMSDMAPRTTGNTLGDHVLQIELATAAARIAEQLLADGGSFVVKVFDGEDAAAFVQRARIPYTTFKRVKPEAVRRNSREFFLVCLGFQSAKVIRDVEDTPRAPEA
jgi:23S rRNA (uridine2552-2'-O)-methyltransferase